MGPVRIVSVFALLSILLVPQGARAQDSLQTYISDSPHSPASLVEKLASQMPAGMNFTEQNEAFYISYAGQRIPRYLGEFLLAEFENLDSDDFVAGKPVNISLALVPSNTGSEIRLMMMAQQGQARALPEGAEILLSDGASSTCSGQMVLSHDGGVKENSDVYVAWAEAAGFALTDASDENLSFFFGQRATCSIFMYVQPDPDAKTRSMVVVRYVED